MLRDKILEQLDRKLFIHSCIFVDNTLDDILRSLKFNYAIELGTLRGLSAIILAEYAKEKVYTFDVEEHIEKYEIWKKFKVEDKIYSYVAKDRKEIKRILEDANYQLNFKFDLAFIDTVHDYNSAKADFELVKNCKYVIFHDADLNGVDEFINETNAKIINKTFAIWENKNESTYS